MKKSIGKHLIAHTFKLSRTKGFGIDLNWNKHRVMFELQFWAWSLMIVWEW